PSVRRPFSGGSAQQRPRRSSSSVLFLAWASEQQAAVVWLALLLLLCERGARSLAPITRRGLVLVPFWADQHRGMGTCLSSPPEEPASIKRLRRSSRGSGDAVW
ncbi:unnamed protein product, partial [Ectocarpus fasciculatus]